MLAQYLGHVDVTLYHTIHLMYISVFAGDVTLYHLDTIHKGIIL